MHQTRPITRPRRPRRSPLATGCTFAILLFALLAVGGYGLVRAGFAPSDALRYSPAAILRGSPNGPSQPAATQASALSGMLAAGTASASAAPDIHNITTPYTPPASPTPIPPISTATRSRLPIVASDLLYLSQNRLMRWDRLNGSTLSLADNVTLFTTSANGLTAVLLRPRKVAANGVERFDLDLLDLQTLQITQLLTEMPNPLDLALSPDGAGLAYILPTEDNAIYVLKTGKTDIPPALIGNCEAGLNRHPCSGLDWSPDSKHLLWGDSHGIWLAAPEGGPARVIYPDRIQITDPQGKTSQIEVQFTDPAWSPTGRFVLLTVNPVASTVSWQSVLDTTTGRLAQASDSFRYAPTEASAMWLPDGTLMVAHASNPQHQTQPFVHIWGVMPTSPDLLESRRQYNLYSDAFPFSNTARKVIPTHSLDWPGMIEAHRLGLAVRLFGVDIPPILFRLDLPTGALYKLGDLPADVTQVHWAPDSAGALVTGSHGQTFYLAFSIRSPDGGPLSGGEPLDLRPTLGSDAHSFIWLPPIVRLP